MAQSNKFIHPNDYEGEQVVILSDRILFDARKDDVFIIAKSTVAISTNELHINVNKAIINSDKIQLGLKAKEPLLLGDKTEKLLENIINTLNDIATSISSTVSTPVGTPIPNLNLLGNRLLSKVSNLRKQLLQIKSKQNFTL